MEQKASDSDIIESIYYAANNGADVINMSLGSTQYFSNIRSGEQSDPKDIWLLQRLTLCC